MAISGYLSKLGFGAIAGFVSKVGFGENELPENLYVNPLFLGGSDALPGENLGAPTSHSWAFFSADATFSTDGDGFSITTNSTGDAGVRRNLSYAVHVNNPDITVGQRVRIEYTVENNGSTNTVMGSSLATNVLITDSVLSVPSGSTGVVYIEFTVNDDAFTFTSRVGTGPTATTDSTVKISNPMLYILNGSGSTYSSEYSSQYV